MSECEPDQRRKNMYLLAFITFSLLIALVFWSNYDSMQINKGVKGDVSVFIVSSFVLGIVSLFFVFIAYLEPRSVIRSTVAYIFSVGFMLFLIQMLIGGYTGFRENILGKLITFGAFWAILIIMLIIIISVMTYFILKELDIKLKE